MHGLFVAISVLVVFTITQISAVGAEGVAYSICSAGDSQLVGSYTMSESETLDDAPVWTNGNDISFFRNKGFWYIGDLGPWPPETHYRCVEAEGCNQGEAFPPTEGGIWTASKRFGKEPLPVISVGPCASEEL